MIWTQGISILFTVVGVAATVNSCLEARFTTLEGRLDSGISEIRGYLVDHIGGHVPDEVDAAETRDREAIAILAGASPEEWTLGGVKYAIDDRVDVDAWRMIDPMYPDGNRTDPRATCSIEEGGALIVRGFSMDRQEALVQYEISGLTLGQPCETGTLLFSSLTGASSTR